MSMIDRTISPQSLYIGAEDLKDHRRSGYQTRAAVYKARHVRLSRQAGRGAARLAHLYLTQGSEPGDAWLAREDGRARILAWVWMLAESREAWREEQAERMFQEWALDVELGEEDLDEERRLEAQAEEEEDEWLAVERPAQWVEPDGFEFDEIWDQRRRERLAEALEY
jgi:hypothetical protein